MRFSFCQRAGEHERFAPGAFDSQVGKLLPLALAGQQCGWATVVAVEVAEDGRSVEITCDTDDERAAALISAGVARNGALDDRGFTSGPALREGMHIELPMPAG